MDRRDIEGVAREPAYLKSGQETVLENCARPL
jgi:hypothetical protein